ncbi:hypothetical protein ACOME3_000646 [Neoechinorhynchus agilis]
MKTKSKFKVKHQKRKLFRANEPFFSVFMWGVNYSAVEMSHVNMPVMLLPDDFKAYMKVKVDLQYFNQDVLPGRYKFKIYCPLVFRAFRRIFGVTERQWQISFTSGQLTPFKNQEKMWLSADKKFYVRSITSEDVANLHSLLADTHKHYIETSGNTLLPKFLGLFRLSVDDKSSYLLVLKSIFSSRLPIHEIYDIKGSTVDRFANSRERLREPPEYKDNDFVNAGRCLYIGETAKQNLLETLKRDTEFLARLNIMDYSLVIGIHDVDAAEAAARLKEEQEMLDVNSVDDSMETGNFDNINNTGVCTAPEISADDSDRTSNGGEQEDFVFLNTRPLFGCSQSSCGIASITSAPRREIYFLGISKMLTFYGTRKKTAHLAKTAKYGAEAEISSVKPEQYARRLMDFVDRVAV